MSEDIKNELMKIMEAFPESVIKYFVYGGFELILDKKHIFYISLNNLQTSEELKRRFISSVSRCYKTEPYQIHKKNIEYQKAMMKLFNKALGTNFTEKEIRIIYTKLGNGCNKELAYKLIESGYDLGVLKDE